MADLPEYPDNEGVDSGMQRAHEPPRTARSRRVYLLWALGIGLLLLMLVLHLSGVVGPGSN